MTLGESEHEAAAPAKRRIEFVRVSLAIDLMQYHDYKPFELPSVRAGEHLTSRRGQGERQDGAVRRVNGRAGKAETVKKQEKQEMTVYVLYY